MVRDLLAFYICMSARSDRVFYHLHSESGPYTHIASESKRLPLCNKRGFLGCARYSIAILDMLGAQECVHGRLDWRTYPFCKCGGGSTYTHSCRAYTNDLKDNQSRDQFHLISCMHLSHNLMRNSSPKNKIQLQCKTRSFCITQTVCCILSYSIVVTAMIEIVSFHRFQFTLFIY